MKRIGMTVFAAALSMGVSFGASAQDDEYEAMNTGGFEFDIDADLGDWALVTNAVELSKFTEHDGGKWNGKDDHSVRFRIVWNTDGVYLAIEVTDDSHLNTNAGAAIWNGDGVQSMIDPENDRLAGAFNGAVYAYNFGLGGANSKTPEFQREAAHAKAPNASTVEYAFARNEGDKLTVYELFFPAVDLSPAPMNAGHEIGFALIVNDGDDEAGQDGQKGWTGWGENAIVFGKDPASTNLVTLSSETLSVEAAGKLATSWGAIKGR